MKSEQMHRNSMSSDEAVSIQVGFVINTGIITAFTAIVLVAISGGFGEDLSTEQELELVADNVESNLVEADMLAESGDTDEFTAFFSPPTSDVDYRAEIDGGVLTVSADDGTELERDLNSLMRERSVDGSITFSQDTENIIVEYDAEGTDNLELDVQRGATAEVGDG